MCKRNYFEIAILFQISLANLYIPSCNGRHSSRLTECGCIVEWGVLGVSGQLTQCLMTMLRY